MQPPPGLRSALMVIGSASTRWMYADYLGWRGVSVREVPSAGAALDYLSAFTPDVTVIEDRLPDSSGLELVRALRRYRGTSFLPVALLSSDVFGIDGARAKKYGCDLLLTVPCLPESLFTSLVELVQQRAAEPRPMAPDSWLFVSEDRSVMIVRTREHAVKICGPGHKRRRYRFASELEMVTFQVRYEHRLVNEGYMLEAFRTDRRVHTDRRRIPAGIDRRASSQLRG
jgi:CheY-like chemotaxis protein